MSTDTNILDSLVKHQIFNLRRAGGINNELKEVLEAMRDDIVKRLERETRTEFKARRLLSILTDIDQIIDEQVIGYKSELIDKLNELVDYEAGFTQRLMAASTSANFALPSSSILNAIVANTKMELQTGKTVQKLTLDKMLEIFTKAQKKQVKTALQSGILAGDSIGEIVKNIKRIQTGRTQAQAYAITRTATNAVTTAARDSVYLANDDVIRDLEWVSVLDDNTTFKCGVLDGQYFTIGNHPPCPRHYNCRSLLTPRVKDDFKLDITGGKRASMFGPTNAQTTFSGFLNRQSAAFQDEYLGKTRGRLYRNGGLKLDAFFDKNGANYTIEQLRKLEPLAFEKSNL